MNQKPKRLTPKPETLRELFLKSGNLCAFPNCTALMMDEKGVFVGQLCHIEAAEPGGERFNPAMTNEQRRAAENLMLMCYPHHRVTNNVKEFTVAKLHQMKREHDQRFSRPDRAILERLTDRTLHDKPTQVANLRRINKVLGWKCSEEELAESASALNEYIERFSAVPIEVRRFLGAVAQRMHRIKGTAAVREDLGSTSILVSDVRDALGIGNNAIKSRLAQMDSYGLGDLDEINMDLGPQPMIRIWAPERAPSWLQIIAFCEKALIPFESFVDDLNFAQLDF
jgi:hypothetical protein